MPWPETLPLALMRIRSTPRAPTFYSPFEIMYGRTFLLGHDLAGEAEPMGDYLPVLQTTRAILRDAVNTLLPSPNPDHRSEDNLAGQHVLIRQPADKLQPRWTGLLTVVYSTPTAVKVCGLPHWIHRTKIKVSPLEPHPRWRSKVISPTTLQLTKIPENLPS